MTFEEEIKARSLSEDMARIKRDVWSSYGDFLFGSDIASIHELTDFQAAFLDLMDEKWNEVLHPLISKNVTEEFDSWYEEGGSYEKIMMQSLDIKDLDKEGWQIMFEDDNMDLIVHLYMKGWALDHTARTG